MKSALISLLVLGACVASAQFYGYKDAPAIGQGRVATDAANAGTRVDQKLNDYVSKDTRFTDDKGRDVSVGELVNEKPVVLLPIFYQCPGVCTNELDELTRSLQGFKKENVGDAFDVVVVSIDHTENTSHAAKKKETYVEFYQKQGKKVAGREKSADGWHFLTGTEASVKKLTDEIGFRFYRDPKNGSIVHPAALVILTPHGKISRYFLTTEYPQRILLDSINLAGLEKVGIKDTRPFYLACIHVDPLTGERSLNVLNTVKTLGIVTLVVLVASIATMTVKTRRQRSENNEE